MNKLAVLVILIKRVSHTGIQKKNVRMEQTKKIYQKASSTSSPVAQKWIIFQFFFQHAPYKSISKQQTKKKTKTTTTTTTNDNVFNNSNF